MFDHLPVPIRYRASGAIAAWNEIWRLGGREGASVAADLADVDLHPELAEHSALSFLDRHCTATFRKPENASYAQSSTRISLPVQMFWARNGVLFEPTLALHQLIESSDISGDIPMAQMVLPERAFCVIPEAAARLCPGALDTAIGFVTRGRPGQLG